jgi:Tfp pilus assembly protein PilF
MAPTPTALVAGLAFTLAASGCFASRRVHPRSAEELRRGYAFVALPDLERAEVAFDHALEFDPDLVEAENGLGVVARARGDLPLAVLRFRRAVAVDGEFAEGLANLGEALLSTGDAERAERALRRALRLNPDLLEARHNLARSLLRRGLADARRRPEDWAEARRALLHVLEADGRRATAYADLALIDFLSAEPARAEDSWRRAAVLAPEDPGPAHGLCLVGVALRRCAEAIPECERCLRLDPASTPCTEAAAAARRCATPR